MLVTNWLYVERYGSSTLFYIHTQPSKRKKLRIVQRLGYMQKFKYKPDADKELIRYHTLPSNLRKFIVTTFGMKSENNVTLALFYKISYANVTLDVDFLRENQGMYVNYFNMMTFKFLIYFHMNTNIWVNFMIG